ncbi:MAG: acetylxylan esterase [Bacteroidales bacterium]|nr:acetylxylan esterase [Bacteroidales bacterium]
MKRILLICAAIAALTLAATYCTPDNQDPQEEEPSEVILENPVPVTIDVEILNDWVFDKRPVFPLHITNPNNVKFKQVFKIKYYTDKNNTTIPALAEEREIEIPAEGFDMQVSTQQDLDPGFYKVYISIGRMVRTFTFGINPTEIVSAPDKQSDFNKFWQDAKTQLDAIEMDAQLTEITSRSSATRKVYLVELKSIPDGPEGEPVTVRGYYIEPQDDKKHPVLLHFYGYDVQKPTTMVDCPYGGNSDYAEFYFSTRGQMLNNRNADKRVPDGKGDFVNTYGDWFAFNFGQRDAYYYRGAFMDCVQAIRFMAAQPTSDMNNLFAEGSSQGGALSYAAAALSDYPFTAIAPAVAFLGDFPDYFQIVGWPANTAKKNRGSMTDEEMYAFLSYFDTKNLVTLFSPQTAVIACIGLQDETCPPHTNIAPYNNLPGSDKEIYYYPKLGHEIPNGWYNKYGNFFKARMK